MSDLTPDDLRLLPDEDLTIYNGNGRTTKQQFLEYKILCRTQHYKDLRRIKKLRLQAWLKELLRVKQGYQTRIYFEDYPPYKKRI